MKYTYIIVLLFSALSLSAQTLPVNVLPKAARTALQNYVLIPGGDFTKNLYVGSDSLQFQFPQQTAVDSFYMSKYEVTVAEYRQFYVENGDAQNKYDTAVWTKDFPYSFNEPMCEHYYNHPSFSAYPAVGITWEQAMRFCQWKSAEVNRLLKNSGYEVVFTLPTDAQWQYAAIGPERRPKGGGVQNMYPWHGAFMYTEEPKDGIHFHCNIGPIRLNEGYNLFDYASDGGLYTMPVESFEANGYGLYQMGGNVAEWTLDYYAVDYAKTDEAKEKYKDKPAVAQRFIPAFPAGEYDDYKIVKGGSWADSPFYTQAGVIKIQHPDKASSTVGFRPVLRIYRKL